MEISQNIYIKVDSKEHPEQRRVLKVIFRMAVLAVPGSSSTEESVGTVWAQQDVCSEYSVGLAMDRLGHGKGFTKAS